jgi:hypothetical protein
MKICLHVRKVLFRRILRSLAWNMISICMFLGLDQLVSERLSQGLYSLKLTKFERGRLQVENAPFFALPTLLVVGSTAILAIRLLFRAAALRWCGRIRRYVLLMAVRSVDSTSRTCLVLAIAVGLLCVKVVPACWGMVAVVLLGLEAVALRRFVKQAVQSRAERIIPLCRTCGYNLRGSAADRCPECGSPSHLQAVGRAQRL